MSNRSHWNLLNSRHGSHWIFASIWSRSDPTVKLFSLTHSHSEYIRARETSKKKKSYLLIPIFFKWRLLWYRISWKCLILLCPLLEIYLSLIAISSISKINPTIDRITHRNKRPAEFRQPKIVLFPYLRQSAELQNFYPFNWRKIYQLIGLI